MVSTTARLRRAKSARKKVDMNTVMTLQEKSLYHQIHPTKLFTDWSTGLIALYLLWQHSLVAALLIAFLPSIVVSLVIIRFVDLEKQKQSSLGRYVH